MGIHELFTVHLFKCNYFLFFTFFFLPLSEFIEWGGGGGKEPDVLAIEKKVGKEFRILCFR